MAYVVDICFEKVDIKDKIRKLPLKEKQEQSAAAYQNFYNTILSDPTSDECEELKTFILYYPHKPGDQHAFIDTNIFAHHLLNMGKNVFFLKFIRSKNKNMPDTPEFSIPINCSDVSELTCEGTKGLETKVVDFGDPDVDIHLAQRFPDVIVPPTWFCTEEEHLRIGGGAYNWFKFVKKVEILWKRKPKVCSVIYDFQFKPKKLLSELCKCRKRAEFLKMDHVFPGDDPDNFRFENWADPPSSEDEHHHGHRFSKPRVSMSTDGLEYEMGLFAPTVPQVSAVRE